MQNATIQSMKARLYCKLSEIILAALLAVAISVFAYSISAQAKHAERLRTCETETALNGERIEGMRKSIASVERNVLARLDERFDALVEMLNLMSTQTGGK